MLHEPSPVLLDRGQGEQVEQQAQRDLVVRVGQRLDLVDEGVQDEPLDVCVTDRDDMVLDSGEDLRGLHALVHAALEATSRAADQVLLTGTEHRLVERSEEHTSELQSLMRISYAVFCLKKKK